MRARVAARPARGPMDRGEEEAPAKARAVPDFSLRERLDYEKELLGFYITGHPLDDHRRRGGGVRASTPSRSCARSSEEIDTRLCGLVTKVEVRVTKEGKKPWARVTFEDLTGAHGGAGLSRHLRRAAAGARAPGTSWSSPAARPPRRHAQAARRAAAIAGRRPCEQLLTELVLRLPLGGLARCRALDATARAGDGLARPGRSCACCAARGSDGPRPGRAGAGGPLRRAWTANCARGWRIFSARPVL